MPRAGGARPGFPLVLLLAVLILGWGLPKASAADIEVNSADPPEMEQAQTIDVIIKGNGFDSSAAAKFFVSGTKKTGGVTVNSTTLIDEQALRANVTAAADAVIGSYDIEVRAANGRRGKGIELFAVKQGQNNVEGGARMALVGVFRDEPGDFFTPSDRMMSDCKLSAGCPYVDGEPGIDLWLKLGIVLNVNSSGDLGTRGITLNFSDCTGGPCTPPFIEQVVGDRSTDGGRAVDVVVFDAREVPLGGALMRDVRLRFPNVVDPADGKEKLWQISFRVSENAPQLCENAGSGPLLVSHPSADEWIVEAGTTNLACLTSGDPITKRPQDKAPDKYHGTFRMPFKLTLTPKP